MSRRRIALAAGCALAAIALLTVTLSHSTPGSEPRRSESSDTRLKEGTEPDAVAVALEVAPATQDWLYLTDDELRADLDRLATEEAAPRLARAATESATDAREALDGATGPVWWIVRPLAWRVEAFDGIRATVSVWEIQILAARDVAAPQSRYRTVAIDLEWTAGRWLVSDLVETAGPAASPAPGEGPWDSRSFDQALEGFTRVGVDR